MTCFKYRLKDQREVTAKCESPAPTSSGWFFFLDLGIFVFLHMKTAAAKRKMSRKKKIGTEERANKA